MKSEHGAAPEGIALSADEDRAYVFCRATDDVVVLDLAPDGASYRTAPRPVVSLVETDPKDKAAAELRRGKALFYDAVRVGSGMACAGCHPEGRADGHVWREANITLKTRALNNVRSEEEHFTNFFAEADISTIRARWGDVDAEGEGGFGYARKTPMLAGRVKARGPYGWHGESADLGARILAGFGLHTWRALGVDAVTRSYVPPLVRFVREGLVPPPRPERALTDAEQRGKALFLDAKTKCASCHAPATDYTDRSVVALPKINPPRGFAEDPNALYKVPSLLDVGGAAPYLHDGRFLSLESLVEYNQDRMGATSQLTADERADLIAFLRTL